MNTNTSIDSASITNFTNLVRLGIGHQASSLIEPVDWDAIEALAERQGLSAVVLDGINRLPEAVRPPKIMLLQWIGEVMQGYEQRYGLYRKAVVDLGAWYHANGFRMMVLKGLACGIYWPKPEHRPYGDIDIYLFGQYKEADKALDAWFKVHGSTGSPTGAKFKIDKSHHHHTVFHWQGFTVENHYDFLNVHHHKSMMKLERVLKNIVEIPHQVRDENRNEEVSANFHALFLLRHAMTHFAAKEISIRHLLDWGFYAKAKGSEIDWKWLEETIVRFGMKKLYDVFNAICVSDLGFDMKTFPKVQYDPFLKERVLNDILSPEFDETAPKNIIRRSIFKYRRWKANEWKHELCYNESMMSALWSGVWNHLIKPSSI